MPPRSTPPPKGAYNPQHDPGTYYDLLMFEERLKTTAASLQRRKSRYQFFLFQLLVIIAFLLFEVVVPPHSSLLAIPYKWLLQRLLPDIYTTDTEVTLHPYFASGLLFVSVTTLALFFASGMYSEKIAYANKYVPHANRALRSFNILLNVRKPPLRSKFPLNPLSFFFPRPDETPRSPRSPSPTSPYSRRSSSPGRRQVSPPSSPQFGTTTVPIQPIPPSSNPRGELIFSSRIDKGFRESYERFRTAYERKREKDGWKKHWWGRVWYTYIGRQPSEGPTAAPPISRTASGTSSRGGGRTSRSGTPPIGYLPGFGERGAAGSRSSSPGSARDRSGSPMRRQAAANQGGAMKPKGDAGAIGLGKPGGGRQGTGTGNGPRDKPRREASAGEVDMRTIALERSLVRDQMHGP
ncbi:hypothetical protein BDN72DRAFT_770470 [Pluteus cervinus]|uniref:Uncharacterized protein n=1 Tax=Pluteus cervinus TaxID=181527 RepID=A0ACD3API5_9AGAR|nr:hypothetical protein BDN72DRAFT_770470 [Pluteus cervinus]